MPAMRPALFCLTRRLTRRANGRLFLALSIILLALLSGCAAPVEPARPAALPAWTAQNLLGVEPPQAAVEPALDLLAVYSRRAGRQLDLRVDLLDLTTAPELDLWIALDTLPGGAPAPAAPVDASSPPLELHAAPLDAFAGLAWDALLYIPAAGELQALDPAGRRIPNAALRVLRDAAQDSIELRAALPGLPLTGDYRLQALTTRPGQRQVQDRSQVYRLGGSPPARARAALVFWNVYPAYTPAAALRRWSGAHTGPQGGSHGLAHLLRAARQAHAPLVLLDLARPETLSALDYAGQLDLLGALADEGLYVPDSPPPAPGGPSSSDPLRLQAADIAAAFGLRRLPGAWTAQLPAFPTQQVSTAGLELDERRRLAAAAALSQGLPAARAPVTLLGGSLPNSSWGIPGPAQAAFDYINNHPWIELLDPAGLARLDETTVFSPNAPGGPSLAVQPAFSPADQQALQPALQQAPPNELRQAAWQAYRGLSNPISQPAEALPALRAVYAGQVWSL
ncbi:MAG: hypothetical protein ACKOC5_11010, partial [Chloroflexota bacterium]